MSAPGAALDPDRPWRSTVTGRVDVTSLLRAGERRTVRICLPDDYEQTQHDYPVLYMFDGHNLFDRASTTFGTEWRIDETVAGLTATGALPGLVVVGIDAPEDAVLRYVEYTAWDWELRGEPGARIVAGGAVTADFLVGTVIPYVQSTYRVARERDRVGLAGSSMGGYMTLYAGTRHSDAFGRLLGFSPVVLDAPMPGRQLRAFIGDRGFDPGTWVYLDMGDREELPYTDPEQLVANLGQTTAAVAGASRPPERLVSRVIAGADHSEAAWGARFGEVVHWAFAGGPQPR